MKALAFGMATVALLFTVAIAQEESQAEKPRTTLLDVLKVGDWIAFNMSPTRELLDFTLVNKPEGFTIEQYREERSKAMAASRGVRGGRGLRGGAQIELSTAEQRTQEPDDDVQQRKAQRDREMIRSGPVYELTAIGKDYVALNSGTAEYFVAASAIRIIRRDLPDKEQ